MASHQLIEAYLAGIARRLPSDTVDELADGLIEPGTTTSATGLWPSARCHTH